jgi:surfactin synthase thioesterase subunit
LAQNKYVWQTGYLLNKEGLHKLDPQPIAERLDFLRTQNGGAITPDDVLKDAEIAESPLAVLFTNSMENDAYEYRKQIARTVVNSIRVEVVKKDTGVIEKQYAWVSIANKDNSRSYYRTDAVVRNKTQLDRVLQQAERDLERWERRYHMLVDLIPILTKKAKNIKKKGGK